MNRRTFVKTLPALTVLASTSATFAQNTPKAEIQLKVITLPKAEMDGGKSVLAALKERKTTRNINAKELPAQVLSNVLWAAFGVANSAGPLRRRATHRKSIYTLRCPAEFICTKRFLTDWHP